MTLLRPLLLMLLLCCNYAGTRASHITGGALSYSYDNGQYTFTLKLYMRCNSGRTFNNPTIVSVFHKSTGSRITDVAVSLHHSETISITENNPCVSNPPVVCYEVGYYIFTLDLPASPDGYVVSTQANFRINGISNLIPSYSNIGATYTCEVPGNIVVPSAAENYSAVFTGSDLVIVCANSPINYSFAATDHDFDQLRYYFCEAFQSGSNNAGASAPGPPPYTSVPYGNGYSGNLPLGSQVQIDANTGLITGIAPPSGIYIVTVCVDEIRNGEVIATQRKDLQINIAECSIASAQLESEYQLCDTSFTINLQNLSNSPLITSNYWQIFNRSGTVIYTSSNASISYAFADTGLYRVKLSISTSQCADTTSAIIRVYPGFLGQYSFSGYCFPKPTLFTDLTTSVYGTVNYRMWDFGETLAVNDTSLLANPSYTYPTMGQKAARLIIKNTVGCRDTVIKQLLIFDKPPIDLSFRDTLLCINDNVQIHASGSTSSIFSWTPLLNITNANTASPTVSPTATRKYYVNIFDNGCLNTDSVLIRVTDRVNVQVMNDTLICQGDTIQIRAVSDGLKFTWTPASQLIDPDSLNPRAITINETTYRVTAHIGSCTSTDDITVRVVPYPTVYAGPDSTICFNATIRLSGQSNGSNFKWIPATYLSDAKVLLPVARPPKRSSFILYVSDTKGCPKTVSDTVIINVLPAINASAGRDTLIFAGQSLQLSASGGERFVWSPALGLSNLNIYNPVALLLNPVQQHKYTVKVYNNADCVDSASINIKVFAKGPEIFVPNAFSPNGDGVNDFLIPICAGIRSVNLFRIYNRSGQLVFASYKNDKGWDGKFKGVLQDNGAFVWMVDATDYNGNTFFKKGFALLLR